MVWGLAPRHAAWTVVAPALAGSAEGFVDLTAGEAFVQREVVAEVAKVAAFAEAEAGAVVMGVVMGVVTDEGEDERGWKAELVAAVAAVAAAAVAVVAVVPLRE